MPPIRKRLDDLPLLVEHFLQKASLSLGKKKPSIPLELISLLRTYSFPGNIRELEAMIFDAISKHESGILSMKLFKDIIIQKDSPINNNLLKTDDPLVTFSEKLPTLKEIEKTLITEAMKRSNNNQSIAAGLLGITRQALNKRLKFVDS